MFTLRQLLFCYVIMPLCHKSLIQMTILNGISWCTTVSSHVMFTIMLLSLSTLKFQHWAIRTSRSISSSLGDALLAQAAGFFSDPPPKFFTFLKCSRAINEMGFRLDSRLPITFPVLQHVIFVSDNFLSTSITMNAPSRYKGHIFRIGAASHASDRGLSDAQIRLKRSLDIRIPSLSSLYNRNFSKALLLARAAIFPYLL